MTMTTRMQCGYCGDLYEMPPEHQCWLAQKFLDQDVIEPVQGDYLEIGHALEDQKLPEQVRKVDLSNL